MFGVCVGMQVLFERSEEDPGRGLGGACPAGRGGCPDDVKVPHMGWNEVTWRTTAPATSTGVPDGTRFYFVHSYAPDANDDTVGVTEHGRGFTAAVAPGQRVRDAVPPREVGRGRARDLRELREGGRAA